MSNAESRLSVVFGGANGIGAACCRLMSSRGWRIAVVDIDDKATAEVAAETGVAGYCVDIRDLAAVERLAADIEREHGPVYALVVSSGAFQERSAPADLPTDTWRKIFEVNVEGTFNANRVFGTLMAKRGRGSIVNVASHSGQVSTPLYAYGPSKAAVLNLTRALAVQWARSGVRVNSVSPGHTMVPRKLKRPPGRYAADANSHIALGRHIEPVEVAEGVEFLVSDRASAITGIDLLIDAGLVAAGSWEFFGGVPPSVAENERANAA